MKKAPELAALGHGRLRQPAGLDLRDCANNLNQDCISRGEIEIDQF